MKASRGRNHKRIRAAISPSSLPSDTRVLNFSFKHLHLGHEWFQLSNGSTDFFEALLRQLKYYGEMSVEHFVLEDPKESRHTIPWETTNLKKGFEHLDPNVVGTETAWQFCLHDETPHSENKWRVYGFIDEETFHIVWLDAEHRLKYNNAANKQRKGKR